MVDYWRRDKVPVGPWTGVTRYNVPVGLSRPGTQRRLEILHGSGPLLLFYTWVQMWSIENGSRTGTPPATYQRMERKEVTTEYGHKLPFLQNLTLGTDVGRTSCLYLRVYNGFSPHLVPPVRPSFFLTSSEDPRPTL